MNILTNSESFVAWPVFLSCGWNIRKILVWTISTFLILVLLFGFLFIIIKQFWVKFQKTIVKAHWSLCSFCCSIINLVQWESSICITLYQIILSLQPISYKVLKLFHFGLIDYFICRFLRISTFSWPISTHYILKLFIGQIIKHLLHL